MDIDLKALVLQLREDIPIGIQEGMALLKAHEGNIEHVKQIWMDQILDEIVKASHAPKETAKIYFVGYLFDKKEAIKQLKKVGFGEDRSEE